MPNRIKLGRERAEVCKLIIWLMRHVCVEYMSDENFGASSGDVLLCCAILVGQVERRAMTPGNLADYIGMPRTTVTRRLKILTNRGLAEMIDGRAYLTIESLNRDARISKVSAMLARVHRASAALSKMDSKPIA